MAAVEIVFGMSRALAAAAPSADGPARDGHERSPFRLLFRPDPGILRWARRHGLIYRLPGLQAIKITRTRAAIFMVPFTESVGLTASDRDSVLA
jgi:hypothetical protein